MKKLSFLALFIFVLSCAPSKYIVIYSSCTIPAGHPDRIEFEDYFYAKQYANIRKAEDLKYDCPASYTIVNK